MDLKNPLAHLPRRPIPGVEGVEEIELENGVRCLAPTMEWTDAVAKTPEGDAMAGFYMFMGLIGMPAQIILTIAAVRYVDVDRKIDHKQWILTRSNWSKDDQDGALMVLEKVDQKLAEQGLTPSFSSKKIDDDYRLN